ncbi:hypothetical protein BGZ73_004847 [Actinomortierella ambigua]|nr:hypothetical protein BGZ73_004847 [Actinomortierella ambigua]
MEHYPDHHHHHHEDPEGHDDCTHVTVAITACDSWLGYCLADYLAEKLKHRRKDIQLRCLAVNIECLDHLKKHRNIHVQEIDYDTEDSLRDAFRNVDGTILIPELDEKRVEQAKKVIDGMCQQLVKCSMLLSALGADAEDLPELHTFHDIEEALKDKMPCHLILRAAFKNQLFFLWQSAIQQKGELPMSVNNDSAMSPLNMHDIFHAIEAIVAIFRKNREHHDHHHHHHHDSDDSHFTCFRKHTNVTYTLTGPNVVTAEQITQTLTEVIQDDIQFKSVSRNEMKQYFKSVMKRTEWSNAAAAMIGIQASTEPSEVGHKAHILCISDALIAILLDELELTKRGEASFVTDDLRTITGHYGQTVRNFFEKEKKHFRRQYQ